MVVAVVMSVVSFVVCVEVGGAVVDSLFGDTQLSRLFWKTWTS